MPVRARISATSSGVTSTTTATTRTRPSASSTMSRATFRSQRRFESGQKLSPIASTPSAIAHSASEIRVTPQILIAVTMRKSSLDVEELFDLLNHLRRLNGLGDVGVCAECDRPLTILGRALGRDDDDRHVRVLRIGAN